MLAWIVRHSPWLMLGCCFAGFLLPRASEWMLPFLPQVLFFLMCFSLLGINQRLLLRALFSRAVWGYAALHGVGMCMIFSTLAWLFGARGEWLIAIAAIGATSPLFSTGALVQTVGLDPLPAMARTIAATLLLPPVLLVVMFFSGKVGAEVDFYAYILKLAIYIAEPMLLAVVLRSALPDSWLLRIYPRVAQFAVLSVFAFPFGLMAAFRHYFDAQGILASLLMLALAVLLCFGACLLMFLLYRRAGDEAALQAALVGGSRNVLLTMAIAGSFFGAEYLVLIGAFQLPMFAMPVLARLWVARRQYA